METYVILGSNRETGAGGVVSNIYGRVLEALPWILCLHGTQDMY